MQLYEKHYNSTIKVFNITYSHSMFSENKQ